MMVEVALAVKEPVARLAVIMPSLPVVLLKSAFSVKDLSRDQHSVKLSGGVNR